EGGEGPSHGARGARQVTARSWTRGDLPRASLTTPRGIVNQPLDTPASLGNQPRRRPAAQPRLAHHLAGAAAHRSRHARLHGPPHRRGQEPARRQTLPAARHRPPAVPAAGTLRPPRRRDPPGGLTTHSSLSGSGSQEAVADDRHAAHGIATFPASRIRYQVAGSRPGNVRTTGPCALAQPLVAVP